MSLIIPSASVLLPWAWKLPELPFRSHPHRYYQHFISRSFSNGAKRFPIPLLRREIPRLRCSESTESSSDESASEKKLEIKQWEFLQSWDVPWDWKVTLYVMLPYLLSIVFAGIAGTTGFTRALQPDFQNLQPHLQNPDEVSMRLFVDQLLKTVAKLSILYLLVSPYQPFPDDVFSYRWSQPFNFQRGWIVWSGGGLIIASSAVFLVKALISGSSAGQMQNEAESLVRLLPLFGQSNASTVFLLGILGVLAPVCEETIYRGFLMTSLTKWLPMPASVVVSSAVFTLAHQSPGKFLEIFIFGMVLGLVYAKTRNLLTPITMHACWNLGVVLTLTFLQVQGYEIQKYIL